MPIFFSKSQGLHVNRSQKITHCFSMTLLWLVGTTKSKLKRSSINIFKNLDNHYLRINLPKCGFAKTEIEWLSYKTCQLVISPQE